MVLDNSFLVGFIYWHNTVKLHENIYLVLKLFKVLLIISLAEKGELFSVARAEVFSTRTKT